MVMLQEMQDTWIFETCMIIKLHVSDMEFHINMCLITNDNEFLIIRDSQIS